MKLLRDHEQVAVLKRLIALYMRHVTHEEGIDYLDPGYRIGSGLTDEDAADMRQTETEFPQE